ncbi:MULTISPECIES: ChrR family anti-sigma-E factor [unclassified Alteromonas]|uniref:ChrR family anti-sigma-E factor n=1 Tax=unclassified Alteromonas TaxID=2614992 RepID=UPI0005098029|nr:MULTISPECIES: ChrR family anti-sigma-E factor [unclassified Alteromonas]
MIKFHPSPQQITEFVEGSLTPAVSLLVSAHCDMCEQCQMRIESETESLAANMVLEIEESFDESAQFGDMLSQITQAPSSIESDARTSKETSSFKEKSVTIELDGRTFKLPRTLHRYIDKTGNWSSLVGKLWQAPVDLGNQGVANFIFMGSGGSVPEHTHRGTEYTLVIDGEFSDGLANYDTGDFIFMDGNKTHTPKSDTKEGCLVFSIVDQPLHFTSGLARLLNPFSHLFFR